MSTAPDVATDGGLALSYALYVLARNGMAPVGDLRYIADVKMADLSTPTAKAQIAAALAMLGDRVQSGEGFRRGARRAAGGREIRRRPSRLRLAAARCRGGGHARRRRRCAEIDPGQRHGEDRDGAQQGDLYLDAGGGLARARRAGARQAECEPHRQRQHAGGPALSQLHRGAAGRHADGGDQYRRRAARCRHLGERRADHA